MITILRKLRVFICLCLSIGIILSSIAVPSFASSTDGNQSMSLLLSANDNKDGEILDSKDNEEDITTERFIIKYKDNEVKEKVTSLLKSKVAESKKISRNGKLDLITTKSKMKKSDLFAELKGKNADVDIEYIQPDYKISLFTNDTYFNDQWGVCDTVYGSVYGEGSICYDVGAVKAWEVSTGAGVVVAVIDTGIDVGHEDLSPNIWSNPGEIPGNGIDDDNNGYIDDVQGWDFCENDNSVHNPENLNDERHGTHVAGIIAAVKDNSIGIAGVAPDAKIMPLKAFTGGMAYTSDIIGAIEYAEQMGAQIVNCSWGTTVDNPALRDTIGNSEMLFAFAAGNNGVNIDINPVYPASYDLPNIIAVASINKDGNLSSFSNYGTTSVDVAAPGEGILSSLPGNQYGLMSGTSIAAPFVTGEAALMLSKYGSVITTKNNIIDFSNTLSTLQSKISDGHVINCYNALTGFNLYSEGNSPTINVSDMIWLRATAGSGIPPQRDADIQGGSLQLRGTTYTKGIGTHSYNDTTPADIEVNIAGLGYNVFDAYVGVDDLLGNGGPSQNIGSCAFKVLVDGVEKVSTPVLNVYSAPYHLTVDITNGSILTLRVTNGGDDYSCDWADWCNPILINSPTVNVSDMIWLRATAGSGISPQRDADIYGGSLQLRGTTYTKGIGTHSYNDTTPADIEVNIAGLGYNVFDAYVGVDDLLGNGGPSQNIGSCAFKVLVDGVEKISTPVLNVYSAPYHISVDIAGGSTLTLRVTNGGDGYTCDWADWCNPVLIKYPTVNVSDMIWLRATAGSGISPQRDADIYGGSLQLRGTTYTKGIGTHSYNDTTPADIEVNIAGLGYNVFDAYVGVDDFLGDNGPSQSTGSCVFQVLVDGVEK